MPKAFPEGFRRDVVAVARRRGSSQSLTDGQPEGLSLLRVSDASTYNLGDAVADSLNHHGGTLHAAKLNRLSCR